MNVAIRPCILLTIFVILVIREQFPSFFVKINCKNNQHNQLNKSYQNLGSIQTC